MPPVFADLCRLLEVRMGKKGKREYVQLLRLIETFSLHDVRAAISDALERGVIGFDAVKLLVLCRLEHRPPRLNLDVYPYLPRAKVAITAAACPSSKPYPPQQTDSFHLFRRKSLQQYADSYRALACRQSDCPSYILCQP